MSQSSCAFLSKVFQPSVSRPWKTIAAVETVSRSQRLLLDNGLIEHVAGKGLYHYMPLCVRALEKLIRIVRDEMSCLNANFLSLSSLCDRYSWEKSGRWGQLGSEFFVTVRPFADRKGREFCLCPTHEESITNLLSKARLSVKQMPLLLYQISAKFRDEGNPRFGLGRSREFLMKDLYSFDKDEKAALKTYESVRLAYGRIFRRIAIDALCVQAGVGSIGGTLSHEYHLLSSSGEDHILVCSQCNVKVTEQFNAASTVCKNCGQEMSRIRSHEIAHTFLLGTRYSSPLQAQFQDTDGQRRPVYMGCYGIGLSRLLSALLDVYSTDEEMRWPISIAPYKVCVIPPKMNSRESVLPNLKGEVIYDDRSSQSVGYRVRNAKRMGYPFLVVVNKTALEKPVPLLELHDVNNNGLLHLNHLELTDYLASV
ncbi:prolyl tRNA synthetase [Trichuris trichiura]|uniref:proline--tRNA ligase n=1 Tax=Trichuris trichiura TaxID=36087 RepID=A0A077ZD58_TRITR|nr:prolyl tRNA synthetase [Trichuris trichiura]